ncbi:MAG TPA: hypothetical protein VJQ57_09315 [Acidimicrobiia bacterium]|nr:hypothetical protein [Acidimicrobiia bacterium]
MASVTYDFTQADGNAVGWGSAGLTDLYVKSNRASSNGNTSLQYGGTRAHGITVSGDWQVDFDFYAPLVVGGGGVQIAMFDGSAIGWGCFVGNAVHIQEWTGGGAKTNQTNTGRTGEGSAGGSGGHCTMTHTAAGVMKVYLDGVEWSTYTDATPAAGATLLVYVANLESSSYDAWMDNLTISDTITGPGSAPAQSNTWTSRSLRPPGARRPGARPQRWRLFDQTVATDQNQILSDSFAFSDGLVVSVSWPLTDSLTVADTAAIAASVPVGDSFVVTDSSATTASIPVSDSLAVSDAAVTTAVVTLTDSGTGSDSATVTVTIPMSDALAGVDSLATTATVALTDILTGSETLALTALVSVSDTGTGTDGNAVDDEDQSQAALSDVFTLGEAIAISVAMALSENAQFLERFGKAGKTISSGLGARTSRSPTPRFEALD